MVTAYSKFVILFKAKLKLTTLWINSNHCPDGAPQSQTLLGSLRGEPLLGDGEGEGLGPSSSG